MNDKLILELNFRICIKCIINSRFYLSLYVDKLIPIGNDLIELNLALVFL